MLIVFQRNICECMGNYNKSNFYKTIHLVVINYPLNIKKIYHIEAAAFGTYGPFR